MRNRGVLAGLAITALLLAGCGGDDDDPATDDRPDVEDELEEPTVDSGTVAAAPTPTAIEVEIEVPRLTYTVVAGDSLGDIAATFGVPLGAIVAVNEMENPDVINIGQEIIIPTQEEVEEWQAAQDAATEQAPADEPAAEDDAADG